MNSCLRSFSAFLVLISATYAVFAEPLSSAPATETLSPAQHSRIVEGYGKLPLSFEPNQGQAEPQVRFLTQGDGFRLSLTKSEAALLLPGKTCPSPLRLKLLEERPKPLSPCLASRASFLRMSLLGSNLDTKMYGRDELPGKSNYFMGNDPSAWRTGISNYRKVQYQDVYPGIDLVYYGNQRKLEHDFIVKPGADPASIRLRFSGAKRLTLDKDGSIELLTLNGRVQLATPSIYQDIHGDRRSIEGHYVRTAKGEIGFKIGAYDRKNKLVIDPTIAFSTYLKGAEDAFPVNTGVDPSGNVVNVEWDGYDTATLQKLNADGNMVLYTTTFKGTNPLSIAMDAQGSAYIAGQSQTADLPIVNAFQAKPGGQYNGTLTKIDSTGSNIIYSTYFGGDFGGITAVAVDAAGSAYITGLGAEKMPVSNPIYKTGQLFAAKLSPSGQSLEYSTYLLGFDPGFIAVDPAGEAIVTGTATADLPTVNAVYPKCFTALGYSHCEDAFVIKLNASGTGVLYSTFLGAGGGGPVATNVAGDAFVVGSASPAAFPVTNALLSPNTGVRNAFVVRLNATGSKVIYATLLGDSVVSPGSIALTVDKEDRAYIAGSAKVGLPAINTVQSQFGGGYTDAFLLKLNGAGSSLLLSTYLGGSSGEQATAVALDAYENVYIGGQTGSRDFPVKDALQSTYPSSTYAPGFLAKISESSLQQFTLANKVDRLIVGPGGDLHYTLTATNIGANTASGSLSVTSVRDRFQACTVSNGDACSFVPLGGRAKVDISDLAKGESRTVTIYATAAKTAGDYNIITNTATIIPTDSSSEKDSASSTVTVRLTADIGITSTLVDNTAGLLHYSHTITNAGPDNSHAVLFLSPLPAHTTFSSASTTAGQCSFKPTIGTYGSVRCPLNNPNANASIKVDIVLHASTDACPAVTDTASITSQSIDGNSANNSSTVVTSLPPSFCAN